MTSWSDIPLWVLFVLVPLLITQGTGLYLHARKHGYYPWLWALWGFISIPLPTILYVLFVVRPWRKAAK
ncbi:hypothetical protein [Paenibacillus taiwanensis]|uniref:hypothetical protein n=1 Tax=Paenibacillus taiwanensis TaxID=401638 RepID=UPI0003F70332|nr:hypothetical protein [Paenibacillus taiwanensis]